MPGNGTFPGGRGTYKNTRLGRLVRGCKQHFRMLVLNDFVSRRWTFNLGIAKAVACVPGFPAGERKSEQ